MLDSYEYYKDKFKELENKFTNQQDYFEVNIPIDDRPLKDCLADQLHLENTINNLLNEICYYKNCCQTEFESIYSNNYSNLVTDSYKDINASEAKQIAMSDSSYIAYKKLYNKYENLYNVAKDVADVIQTRKYTLKTMADSMINGVNNQLI